MYRILWLDLPANLELIRQSRSKTSPITPHGRLNTRSFIRRLQTYRNDDGAKQLDRFKRMLIS